MTRNAPLVVLCVNSGSSSLKTALFEVGTTSEQALARIAQPVHSGDYTAALDAAIASFDERGLPTPGAAGHRVVHGGPRHSDPVVVDNDLLAELREVAGFAPLHMPAAIAGIEAIGARWDIPQVACFDTGFHHLMPEVAQRLPLPESLWDEGVRRYGFHGLSYEYVVGALDPAQLGRAVIAHLGNGASMAAVRGGRSLDTTMGLTPAGGLVMSTRPGDLDPGVAVYLLREKGYDADRLERLIDRESGLVALSGGTSDMKTLIDERDHEPRATLAVDAFCYHARMHVGALATVLGGLDTVVFTGGIGEKSAVVRAEICRGLQHLGVELDDQLNEAHDSVISAPGSDCVVRVVHTDEDLVIARHTTALVAR
ncbi:MAG: acetate/propionate family kinase [Actinomycetota bacterium]|nr:acetate/propionate family kinase [Actinomycetota bacterium]